MALSKTPHSEVPNEDEDIMIYAVDVTDIHGEGFEINADTTSIIHDIIPDVVEKCANSPCGKKAILLYNDEDSTVVQMWYCICYYLKLLLYNYVALYNMVMSIISSVFSVVFRTVWNSGTQGYITLLLAKTVNTQFLLTVRKTF